MAVGNEIKQTVNEAINLLQSFILIVVGSLTHIFSLCQRKQSLLQLENIHILSLINLLPSQPKTWGGAKWIYTVSSFVVVQSVPLYVYVQKI